MDNPPDESSTRLYNIGRLRYPSTIHRIPLADKFSTRTSFRFTATGAARRDLSDSNLTNHASINVLGKYQCLVRWNAERSESQLDRFFDMSI
ncbi:hypothetical protein PGT21_030466 [Puccinia graminis f. sp. tritici]|uniref:Uncharacterized protein n=1 Tax=Puccinia graminis f. sp. tritici TaxID=56615 RepID=A0A5B0MQ89_PUCGR|nr:hypothetical protein PGTUg99_018787 [Puccinia graminis f. sp. tritici]KAA1094800.1 hypothetical protein PGT21_030466 [Puccinia graminis f. sp. tritici]